MFVFFGNIWWFITKGSIMTDSLLYLPCFFYIDWCCWFLSTLLQMVLLGVYIKCVIVYIRFMQDASLYFSLGIFFYLEFWFVFYTEFVSIAIILLLFEQIVFSYNYTKLACYLSTLYICTNNIIFWKNLSAIKYTEYNEAQL